MARERGQRDAPARDVRPLVGPHPDRREHRAAPGAAAVPRGRSSRGWWPTTADERARRRGRDRRRRAVSLRRHADPPLRPRGLLAVPDRGQARLAAGGHLRGARAVGHRGRGAARDHRPPPPRRPVHDRGRDRARRRRARHGPRALAGAVRGGPAEHPLAVGLRDRGGEDLGRTREGRARRDPHVQQRRHLPGRRAAGHQAPRLAGSRSTSRSSPGSRPSRRSACCRCSGSRPAIRQEPCCRRTPAPRPARA